MKKVHNRSIERVVFHRQDDFTVAVVLYKTGLMGVGIAKRSGNDAYSERQGRLLAVKRATPHPKMNSRTFAIATFY